MAYVDAVLMGLEQRLFSPARMLIGEHSFFPSSCIPKKCCSLSINALYATLYPPPPVPTRCPTPLLRCPTGPANIFIGLLPKCSSSECQVLSFSIPTVGCLLKPFAFSRVTLATCRRNVIMKGKQFGRGDTIWPVLATFFLAQA